MGRLGLWPKNHSYDHNRCGYESYYDPEEREHDPRSGSPYA